MRPAKRSCGDQQEVDLISYASCKDVHCCVCGRRSINAHLVLQLGHELRREAQQRLVHVALDGD